MDTFDERFFPNQLGSVNISYAKIIDTLLRNQPIRPNVEDRTDYTEKFNLPSFVKLFYNEYIFKGDFPTQEQFKNKVLEIVGESVLRKLYPQTIKGLEYRINRNYLSVVRELCCILLIRDIYPELHPIYNIVLDVSKRIDCMISHNNQYYGLCFMAGTDNGEGQLGHKKIHQTFDNVEYVNVPIDLDTAPQVANVALYTASILSENLKKYFNLPVK